MQFLQRKKNRGTEIILNISKDSKSFLEDNTIGDLLKKYNRFMPIPIKFGTKEVSKKVIVSKKITYLGDFCSVSGAHKRS